MARTVVLPVQSNLGYSAEQIDTRVTLADLMEAVLGAIEEFGDDARIVIEDGANRYGANFGALVGLSGEVTISEAE